MKHTPAPGSGNVGARLLLAGVLWAARALVQASEQRPSRPLIVALDALLIGVHLWSNEPLRRQDPSGFGRAGSVGALLLVPLILAVFLVFRDVWFVITDTPL